MAKKKADNASMVSMFLGSMLYDLEHKANFPPEYIQALRDELTAHPDKLKMAAEYTDKDFADSINNLLEEVGQKVYGEYWATRLKYAMHIQDDEDYMDYIDEEMEKRYLPEPEVWKYTIRISLKDVSPTVWRKLEIPSNVRLSHLAEILICAMGWEGYHLYQFKKGQDIYNEPDEDDEDDMDFGFVVPRYKYHNSHEYSLAQVLAQKGDKMTLEYDFGDGWEHQVSLSKIESYTDEEPPFPRLISGKNACPPEDCGGPWGYAALCQYYYTRKKDPNFPKEHYALVDKHFNPEYFPLEEYRADIEDMSGKA